MWPYVCVAVMWGRATLVWNPSQAGIPSMIAQYNGKPVLVTKSGTVCRGTCAIAPSGDPAATAGAAAVGAASAVATATAPAAGTAATPATAQTGDSSSNGAVDGSGVPKGGSGDGSGVGGSGGGSGSGGGDSGGGISGGGSSGGSGGGGGGEPYLEMDCNMRYWCYLARKGLHHLLPRFSLMSLRVAFVLEGRADDELPECVLACAQLNSLDPHLARPLS
jgi:Protein ENHANCED DISEASE RESISTANCE 2, C-terminal